MRAAQLHDKGIRGDRGTMVLLGLGFLFFFFLLSGLGLIGYRV